MAKNKITDYSATNASNTDLGGIDIQGTGYISNGDNAFREIMTHLAETNAGTYPVADTWSFADPADLTKIARLDCGSITTATTRVITVPDRNGVLMTGPSSTTDNGIPRFNGTAGDIQTSDSNVIITDTGGIQVAAGSAADPTLSFAGGGDGFYLRNSSSVGIGINASEIGYWSGTGFTFTDNFYITYGGTGAASQRSALGLGSAAVENVATSGSNIAKMDGNNTWSGNQVFSQAFIGNGSAAAPSLALNSSQSTGIWRATTDSLGIATGGSQAMRLTTNHVNIGNQTVAAPGVSNSNTGMTIDHTSYACRISTANGNNLQLNINSSPSDAVDFRYQGAVKGTITVTSSNTAYNTTSDENLKHFTGTYSYEAAKAIIQADPVRSFTWKDGGEAAVGWGAQTSYAVSPDLATPGRGKPGDDDYRPWGVDQGKRTPYLWAAVSGLIDEIEGLKAEIAALKAA